MTKIIVGIDGSDAARAAFDWAYEHGTAQDTLTVLHSWRIYPVIGLEAPGYNLVDFEVEANGFVREFVKSIGLRDDGPSIEQRVVHGAPARVLVDESETADLVVVGSRGLGGFRGALLGSVSTFVVHHAACPVVVVPAPDQGDSTGHVDSEREVTR